MENNSYNQLSQNSQQPQAVDNQFVQIPVSNQQAISQNPTISNNPVSLNPIVPAQVSLPQQQMPASPAPSKNQESILSVEDTIKQQIPAAPIQVESPPQPAMQVPLGGLPQLSTSTDVPLSRNLIIINLLVCILTGLYAYLVVRFYSIILLLVLPIVYLIVFILSFNFSGKIKKNPTDAITPSQNRIMIAVLALNGLIGLSVYYFRLRKIKPLSAKIAVNTWIKCFLIAIVLNFIMGTILYPLIFGSYINAISWRTENYSKVNQLYSTVGKDLGSLKLDVSAGDKTASLSDCQQLSTDVGALAAVKKYPVATTQTKITNALNLMLKGSKDCVDSLQQGDSELFSTSVQEFNDGSTNFYNIFKSI